MNTKIFNEQDIMELARSAYEHGQANFPIIKEKCALLVIDMQDEFVKPHFCPYWVPESTRQIPKIKQMIDACRQMNIPVIYTVFGYTHAYLDRPKSGEYMPNRFPGLEFERSELFVEGKIYHELTVLEDEIVIFKPSYGAFYDTPLETILKNLEKDTVIISGTMTNFCCGTTARQAYERGYKVIFGSDINATDLPEMHEAELKVLRKGFACVMSSAEILAELETVHL
ncbi:MAG: isochorismatase family cysteine hydrolase [Candidatus Vecturithrix sp.]|jgi:nicotinamidase-related amidase|nr:isochorismatase family cysteine hydrolase [Candidatus Vecturithrix sp.]